MLFAVDGFTARNRAFTARVPPGHPERRPPIGCGRGTTVESRRFACGQGLPQSKFTPTGLTPSSEGADMLKQLMILCAAALAAVAMAAVANAAPVKYVLKTPGVV